MKFHRKPHVRQVLVLVLVVVIVSIAEHLVTSVLQWGEEANSVIPMLTRPRNKLNDHRFVSRDGRYERELDILPERPRNPVNEIDYVDVSQLVRIPPWIHKNLDNFPVIVGENLRCSGQQRYRYLAVFIHSRPENSHWRGLVRQTWSRVQSVGNRTVGTYFVLGSTEDINLQKNIEHESDYFNDIIQFDFVDSYYNLSLKTVASLNYFLRSCGDVKFFMKTDDDMLVIYKNVLKAIDGAKISRTNNNLFMGRLWTDGYPIREYSPEMEKYFLSRKEYKPEQFPPYASGSGYVLSRRSAQAILKASKKVPIMHIEDAYLGECAKRARVKVTNYEGFTYVPVPYDECIYKRVLATAHGLSPDEIALLWRLMTTKQTGYRVCPSDRFLLKKVEETFNRMVFS